MWLLRCAAMTFRKSARAQNGEPDPLLVDGSWSMAVSERMSATKGAILPAYRCVPKARPGRPGGLSEGSGYFGAGTYQQRTAGAARPGKHPGGGQNALAAGLQMAYEVIKRERSCTLTFSRF